MRMPKFGLPIVFIAGLLTGCGAAPSHDAIEADVVQAAASRCSASRKARARIV